MSVLSIHHISLTCINERQYEKAIDFYTRIIGMHIQRQWKNGILFEIGNTRIEMFLKENTEQLSQGTIRHFAFLVDSCDEMIEKVRQEGYSIVVEPKDVCLQEDYLLRVGFCIGPTGEEIEFFQERL
ncbi:VOC family protein [Floccifex sp.]|uniref:VOC family protein n=1 Tax=Floccifex sp. TaxID=2815810 RepID=UPI003F0F1C94